MSTISVVVVNWNAGLQLVDCVESIVRYGSNIVEKIIVVDNASVDGSQQRVKMFSEVTLISLSENFGFGKACNIGASYCKSEFILFLNPDAMLFEGTLEKALAFMVKEANQNVGICGVQLVDKNNQISKSCARFPTVSMFLVTALGLDKLFPNFVKSYHMHEWGHKYSEPVDHVIGAFYFVRYLVFKKIRGFDEDFFVYLEDLDFSFRAKEEGWSSYYMADVKAFHAGGGTSDQVKAKRLFYSIRSRIIYSYKHFNFFSAGLVLFCSMFVEPFIRVGFVCMKNSWSSVGDILSAYKSLFIWYPKWVIRGEIK